MGVAFVGGQIVSAWLAEIAHTCSTLRRLRKMADEVRQTKLEASPVLGGNGTIVSRDFQETNVRRTWDFARNGSFHRSHNNTTSPIR
jgi:hypothetical protein